MEDYRATWIALPVSMLPIPKRLSDPDCMSPIVQPRSVPAGATCCWYYRGDWEPVNQALISAMAEVEGSEPADGLWQALMPHLASISTSDWHNRALFSLVGYPIDLDADFGDYGNGQHRAQAMMDQGVSVVVANWNRYQHPVPPWIRLFNL